MSKELLMPKLGLTMEEGTLIRWYFDEGEEINEGDIVYDVETDKITHSVEADQDGILAKIIIEEGETVPVQTVVGILAAEGEELDDLAESEKVEAKKSEKVEEKKAEKGTAVKKVDNKKEVKEDILRASPRAKKLARENDVDLKEVRKTTDRFRIISDDVGAFMDSDEFKKKEAVSDGGKEKSAGKTVKKEMSNYRRTTARRLSESWEAPHIYLRASADISEIINLREKYKELDKDNVPSLNTVIAKITAFALKKHPDINAYYADGEYLLKEDINLGIAVAVDKGLVVPVVKNADRIALPELDKEIKQLIEKSREDKLEMADLEDGTFSISNLGMFEIEEFTAILNPPQVGILAVGTIVEKVRTGECGEIEIYPALELTLGLDHRAVDGAVGAKFLKDVKKYLENPVLVL
ncbi:MAG: dihydrolipoamide acetyltransferase family protein [Bacillota bacterium]